LLAKENSGAMRKTMWLILGITCAFNITLWFVFNQPETPEAPWSGEFNYVSFSPYRDGQDPIENRFPTPEEIMDDLVFLKGKTKGVRTYSSLDGMEAIPGMATRLGLEVTAGAWIDGRFERNEDELHNLILNVNRYPSTIKRVIVGNESIYRNDLSPREVIGYLDRVRAAVKVPVGTAEPWHVFIKNPELVSTRTSSRSTFCLTGRRFRLPIRSAGCSTATGRSARRSPTNRCFSRRSGGPATERTSARPSRAVSTRPRSCDGF
jgi:hypothetical protein